MNELNVMGIIRTMDDLGRIVIPKEIRRTADIKEGDSIDILSTAEGAIILRKAIDNKPTCDCPCSQKKDTEKVVYTLTSEYLDDVTVITITKEQEKLLDYLYENDYINGEWSISKGYPATTDLT